MTTHDRGLVDRIAMTLHDRLYRGSWRSWDNLDDSERSDYHHAARGCLDVLAAETRLCEPTDSLPRPACGARWHESASNADGCGLVYSCGPCVLPAHGPDVQHAEQSPAPAPSASCR